MTFVFSLAPLSRRSALWACGAALFLGAFAFGASLYDRDGAMLMLSGESPRVSLFANPSIDKNKKLQFSFEAWDRHGIKQIALKLTPTKLAEGEEKDASSEIVIATPNQKKVALLDARDFSAHAYAGRDVLVQIVVTDNGDRKSETLPVVVALPERRFVHPIARVLIEQRKKLIEHPEDQASREEAANIMANIAFKPINYRGDPVLLLALRGGAVRLVLGNDRDAAVSVGEILWQAASRLEAGGSEILSQRM